MADLRAGHDRRGASTSASREAAVGWLSQVFPLLYVVLAIPAGVALDRWFRPALLTGAWLTVLGGAVRLSADTFAVALAGPGR